MTKKFAGSAPGTQVDRNFLVSDYMAISSCTFVIKDQWALADRISSMQVLESFDHVTMSTSVLYQL